MNIEHTCDYDYRYDAKKDFAPYYVICTTHDYKLHGYWMEWESVTRDCSLLNTSYVHCEKSIEEILNNMSLYTFLTKFSE